LTHTTNVFIKKGSGYKAKTSKSNPHYHKKEAKTPHFYKNKHHKSKNRANQTF
jgi:hypothetical protein